MTYDECIQALATKTKFSEQEWRDYFSCTEQEQQDLARTYAAFSWAQDPDVKGDILALADIMTKILGVATGAAALRGVL